MNRLSRTIFPAFLLVAIGCEPSPYDLAGRGKVEELRARIEANPALLETTNDLDKTPLFYAVTYNWPRSVAALIELGANVNARDITGMTPLHVAATLDRVEEAELLLAAGANIRAIDEFGDTPLHSAAIFGQQRMISWLLQHDGAAQVRNSEGLMPVDLARRQRKDAAVEMLTQAMQPVVPVRAQ